jgi:hypothetical protein
MELVQLRWQFADINYFVYYRTGTNHILHYTKSIRIDYEEVHIVQNMKYITARENNTLFFMGTYYGI